MGRGVSSGGGQSSLGYLFGNGETASTEQPANGGRTQNVTVTSSPPIDKQTGRTQNVTVTSSPPIDKQTGHTQNVTVTSSPPIDKQTPAGIPGNLKNNYHRADGQNCGNFLTDRPTTKVHAAPGGGSSLGYLFGGPGTNSSV